MGTRKMTLEDSLRLFGSIESWLDEEALQMLAEWSFTSSELERKWGCLFG